MHCSDYSNDRLVMFNTLLQIDVNLLPLNPGILLTILFFGDSRFSIAQNHDILSATVKFICDTRRFSGALF